MHPLRTLALALLVATAETMAGVRTPGWSFIPLSNEVTNIQLWKDTTWIGTYHGIYRTTSTDTTWFHPSNSALPGERILPGLMQVDTGDGSLWATTEHGVARIDRTGAMTSWDSTTSPWLGKAAFGLSVTGGIAYVLTDSTQVLVYAGAWSLIQVSGRPGPIVSIAQDPSHNLWVGLRAYSQALGKVYNGSYQPYADSSGISVAGPVRGLWMHGDSIWASTALPNQFGGWMADTLLLLSPGKTTQRIVDTKIPCPGWQTNSTTCDVASVQMDGTAAVFARGTQVIRDSFLTVVSGSVLRGQQVVDSIPTTGLTLGEITAFALRHDSLWMGSQYPAAYHTGLYLPRRVPHLFQSTLRGTKIVGQFAEGGGRLWIATDSALYLRSDASPAFSDLLDASGCAFTGLASVHDTFWLSSTNGLRSFPGGQVTLAGTSLENVAARPVAAYLRTIPGAVYYERHLSMLDSLSEGMEVQIPFSSDSGTASQMVVAPSGSLWKGSSTWLAWTPNGSTTTTSVRTGWVDGLDATDTSVWASFRTGGSSYLIRFKEGNASLQDSFYRSSGQIGAVLAANDSSAWTFSNVVGGSPPVPATLCRWNLQGLVGSCLASQTSPLRLAVAADNRRPMLADSSGGLWLVESDGIQRWADAGLPVSAGLSARVSSARSPMHLTGNVLSFSLPSGGRAHLEILDLSGRVLVRQDLGFLAAGTHEVKIPRGNGLRFCRVAAGSDRQTLEVAGF
ncbi:MAG TPA: hypothetical protein VN931_05415 [Fibrobacteria bacterium]|nr:hypothetical protein [Fibrobacteria bacterium]